jgi:large subunit ribosomal protein L24
MQPKVRGTSSRHPGAQRKALYRAPQHVRRKRMTLPLSRELRARYRRRRIPVRKGDTVRVLAGSFVGREERVAKIDLRHYHVILDNVTLRKADKKLKQLPMATGHLVITKLNLNDPWRRRVLNATEEEATPEEPEGEETAEAEGKEGASEVTPDDQEEGAKDEAAPARKGASKKGADEEE